MIFFYKIFTPKVFSKTQRKALSTESQPYGKAHSEQVFIARSYEVYKQYVMLGRARWARV